MIVRFDDIGGIVDNHCLKFVNNPFLFCVLCETLAKRSCVIIMTKHVDKQ